MCFFWAQYVPYTRPVKAAMPSPSAFGTRRLVFRRFLRENLCCVALLSVSTGPKAGLAQGGLSASKAQSLPFAPYKNCLVYR